MFNNLSPACVERMLKLGNHISHKSGGILFKEGDSASRLYFLVSGSVSISVAKFNTRVEVQVLGPGSWVGEMAILHGYQRSASAEAREDSDLIVITKEDFIDLLDSDLALAAEVQQIAKDRGKQLVLGEKMIGSLGSSGAGISIGIKGDPSLRESAMLRERYESVVDLNMPELIQVFRDLLLNRTPYRLSIGFNNGEIRIVTVLDPYSEEFHPALRLLDASYLERHFPKLDYGMKTGAMRRFQRLALESEIFEGQSHLKSSYKELFEDWQPLDSMKINRIVSLLPLLRSIPHFYARSVTLNIARDLIHMQFNCDGTHIVTSEGYERFLADNL